MFPCPVSTQVAVLQVNTVSQSGVTTPVPHHVLPKPIQILLYSSAKTVPLPALPVPAKQTALLVSVMQYYPTTVPNAIPTVTLITITITMETVMLHVHLAVI